MKKAIIALYVIVICLFAWVTYACICNLKFCPENSAGVIVASLGVMVTFLVGWQIWKSIEYDKAINRIADLEHILMGYFEFSIGMTALAVNPGHTLMQCVLALEHLNRASNAEYDNIFIALNSIADSSNKEPLNNNNRKRLLKALKNSHQEEGVKLIKKFSDWPLKD